MMKLYPVVKLKPNQQAKNKPVVKKIFFLFYDLVIQNIITVYCTDWITTWLELDKLIRIFFLPEHLILGQ